MEEENRNFVGMHTEHNANYQSFACSGICQIALAL
jgi:hypothetical protein